MSAFASYGHAAAEAIVCYVPLADQVHRSKMMWSFDDFVSEGEQLIRHGEAERFRGLEVDS